MSSNPESTVTIDQLAAVVQRSVSDPAFRAQLLSDPAATLESAGIAIPAGASVQVVQDTENLRHLVVPARPSELSDADLAQSVAESLPSPDSVEASLASYSQALAVSWTDGAFRSQLLSDPAAALAARGISVPAGVQVQAIESSASSLVLAIPPASASASATASSSSSSGMTLGEMAESITSSFTNLTKLITAGSYIAGLGFSIGAVMKFKQHKDNPTQVPIGTPIALVYIAAALLFLPSIIDAKST